MASDSLKLAQRNRDEIAAKGNSLMSDQAGEVAGNEALRNNYRSTADRLYQPMAEGQGGYNPDEAAAISGDPSKYMTGDDAFANNYLTPDEQAGIKGDTSSYGKYFDPTGMSQTQDASAGRQRAAVDNMKAGLNGAINPDALRQSGGYQQDSRNQLDQNRGNFNTILGAVGDNVRGSIDPSKVMASDSFLQDYNMSPEEQQRIVTGAGISAGAKDSAAVGDMERRAAAAGASPMGVGAYRARMARAQAADAGDAMTQARIKASEAAAGRKMSGEQLREQGGQYLTNVKTGTEMGMGQEALQGDQALGAQALNQRNQVEQNRQAAEQYLTDANTRAAATGGAADIATEQGINAQGRQQAQFNTTTGTGIAQNQDVANSARASQVANNRQATGQGNQATRFNQGTTVDAAQSGRAKGIADTRLNQQGQALDYYKGQNAQANQNAENAQTRQVQTYGTQAGGTNTATANAVEADKKPGIFEKIAGGVIGAVGAAGQAASGYGAAKAAGGLEDGGVVTSPSLHTLAEDGPEWVGPASGGSGGHVVSQPTLAILGGDQPEAVVPLGGSSYRSRKTNTGLIPKSSGRRFYGEAA